jgi:torso-like protein
LESTEENSKSGFNGDFHMEFCDNKQQLFQAYFREFQIENLSSPWKAFTDGWHAEITAKKLGINSSYITGDYRLIR